MPTQPEIEHLFHVLHERGCRVRPIEAREGDEPRRAAKILLMNERLQEQTVQGRHHPTYRINQIGRIYTQRPNLAQFRFNVDADSENHILAIGPRHWEPVMAVAEYDLQLAERLCREGWDALGFHGQDRRWVKTVFFCALYGMPTDKLPSSSSIVPGELTPEMFLSLYPQLRWTITRGSRKRFIERISRQLTEILLEVACEIERTWAGKLVTIGFDELYLEGQALQRYAPHIERMFLERLPHPFHISKTYTGTEFGDVAPRNRLDVLFDD